MKILSFGAGMQSTALALMSCENAVCKKKKKPYPLVPIYDAVIFCDLGLEPPWVKEQMEFTRRSCESAGIFFHVLDTPLYQDFTQNFGERRTISIPWWTLKEDGHKSRMPRNCTLDYKVNEITKYVRWELLGYKKGQWLRPADVKAHEMHMGFSAEESRRCHENPHKLFINKFPLVEMGLTRADNYKYILEVWGLDTKASACAFCPFHRNYFFQYIRKNEPKTYQEIVAMDHLLRDKNPKPPMDSDLFISRSRKRIEDLTPADCNDAECFMYQGKSIWNGF